MNRKEKAFQIIKEKPYTNLLYFSNNWQSASAEIRDFIRWLYKDEIKNEQLFLGTITNSRLVELQNFLEKDDKEKFNLKFKKAVESLENLGFELIHFDSQWVKQSSNEEYEYSENTLLFIHKQYPIAAGCYRLSSFNLISTNEYFKLYKDKIIEIQNEIEKDFEKNLSANHSEVYTIFYDQKSGFGLQWLDYKPKISNETNFLSSYPQIDHNSIEDFFTEDKCKGKLLLIRGVPGTGKTTYIRYLIKNKIPSNKKIILANPKLFQEIENPSFNTFLINNLKNSYIIIEDAEQLLVRREGENSPISSLLNLTDGLIGDALDIKIIATFNTKIENIDTALLRKGRLHFEQEFKPLSKFDAENFFVKHGFNNFSLKDENPLCELFNQLSKTGT